MINVFLCLENIQRTIREAKVLVRIACLGQELYQVTESMNFMLHIIHGWQRGVVVTALVVSTKLL